MVENPLIAGWSLTKRCNLKCLHCYNASGKADPDELTTKEAFKVIKKLKKAKVAAVNFGGGECNIREDFIDICKELKKNKIKISYTTNGTTFPLIENHLNLFSDIGVSLDFSNAEKHDWFRGVLGTFERATSTIEKLVEKGVDTEIVTCLTKLNCSIDELQKMYSLAKELNVNNWRVNRFRENGRGIDNKHYLTLSKDDLKTAFNFFAQYIDESVSVPEPLFRAAHGGRYSIAGDPSGSSAFRIQHNGEVSPSVFLATSGGNIKTKSIDEIFQSPVFKQIRNRKPEGKCNNCSSYYHCQGGDAGASYLKYGHFNGPDPLCWLEPTDKRPKPTQHFSKEWNVHEMYLCTLYIPIK
ncbi:MAG: radical SAM protein [archaeon]